MKRITVLLAEDHTVVREGLRKMLELEGDLEVIGEAQDGRQAVALAKILRPAVVLAPAQWFGSHPPDSQSRSSHQSAHALRA